MEHTHLLLLVADDATFTSIIWELSQRPYQALCGENRLLKLRPGGVLFVTRVIPYTRFKQ